MQIRPVDEARNEYLLTKEEEEIAYFDLKERGAGKVFKASVKAGHNDYTLQIDPKDSNRLHFSQVDSLLEAEFRGWLVNKFIIMHEGKEFRLLGSLFKRSYKITDEDGFEYGRIRVESFFSENYLVHLSEKLPQQLMLFIACLGLCDSERPTTIYEGYWYR